MTLFITPVARRSALSRSRCAEAQATPTWLSDSGLTRTTARRLRRADQKSERINLHPVRRAVPTRTRRHEGERPGLWNNSQSEYGTYVALANARRRVAD